MVIVYTEIIHSKIGNLYLELNEESEKLKLYGSNREYIGYLELESCESIEIEAEKLGKIISPYDIVDLGYCENMMCGNSELDLFNTLFDYLNTFENNYSLADTLQILNENKIEVGDYYIITNYHEI